MVLVGIVSFMLSGCGPAPTPAPTPAPPAVSDTWAQYLSNLAGEDWSNMSRLFDSRAWWLVVYEQRAALEARGASRLPDPRFDLELLEFWRCKDSPVQGNVSTLESASDPTMVNHGYSVWTCVWSSTRYFRSQVVMFDADSKMIDYVWTWEEDPQVHAQVITAAETGPIQSVMDLLVSAWQAQDRSAFLGLFTADARVLLYDATTQTSSTYTEIGDCWDSFFAGHPLEVNATAAQFFEGNRPPIADAGAIGAARVAGLRWRRTTMIATLAVRMPEPGVVQISRFYPVWFGESSDTSAVQEVV